MTQQQVHHEQESEACSESPKKSFARWSIKDHHKGSEAVRPHLVEGVELACECGIETYTY